jgi:hypothetical protein
MTLPSGHRTVKVSSVDYPARLFRYGADRDSGTGCPFCRFPAHTQVVDPQTMKNHALVFFGGLAAIVILLGIAFGALSRRNAPPPSASEAG